MLTLRWLIKNHYRIKSKKTNVYHGGLKYKKVNLNKRPMGHIAHLRNQFKSEELWLYLNIDKEKKKPVYLLFKNWMVIICITLSFSTQRMLSAKFGSGVQQFWRGIYLNLVTIILLFTNNLPLEKGMALHLNKLESPLPLDALSKVWLKLAQCFWRTRFWILVPSFEQTWIPFTKGCFLLSLAEIGPAFKKILKFPQYIFVIY